MTSAVMQPVGLWEARGSRVATVSIEVTAAGAVSTPTESCVRQERPLASSVRLIFVRVMEITNQNSTIN